MGRSDHKTASLPLIPLPRGTVLLPGLVQRVLVSSSRPDIPALLAHVYERAAAQGPDARIDGIPIACVPIASPLIGNDGQLLIENGDEVDVSQIPDVQPGNASKSDLFKFGVTARIMGIDGRGSGEFALRIEGTGRCRVDTVLRERPFFDAKVTLFPEQGASNAGLF